jgi:leader peptidase (prepilin peptidase)/N-methyltransferase
MSDPNTIAWLLVLWLFVLGGVVGSFLNVVVYRLPLGLSVIYPPSHCPKCGKVIRWYDNVPILGWIALGGRCRQCRNPISVRYPAVEAVTATLFGVLGAVEMDRLDTAYPVHLLLLCTLLCAGLIEYDGHRPPWRLFLPSLVLGIFATLFWRIPAAGGRELPEWLAGWSGWAAGLAAAIVLIGTLRSQKSTGLGLGLVSIVACLGWHALPIVAAIVAIEALLWLLGRVGPRLHVPPCLLLGVLTLIGILAWAN